MTETERMIWVIQMLSLVVQRSLKINKDMEGEEKEKASELNFGVTA